MKKQTVGPGQCVSQKLHFVFILNAFFLLFLQGCSSSGSQRKSKQIETQEPQSIHGQMEDIVYERITAVVPKLRRCYDKVKRKGQGPKGRLTLIFTILPSGTIQRAGVAETQLPLKLRACAVEVLWKISFPPTPDGRVFRVQQPLRF